MNSDTGNCRRTLLHWSRNSWSRGPAISWMVRLCDTGSTATAPLLCIQWGRTAGMMEEILCLQFRTRIRRTRLLGRGVIGFGRRQWLVSSQVDSEALLRSTDARTLFRELTVKKEPALANSFSDCHNATGR